MTDYDDARGEFSIEFPEVSPLAKLFACQGCTVNRATHQVNYSGVLLNENDETETRYSFNALVCPQCAEKIYDAFKLMRDNMEQAGIEVEDLLCESCKRRPVSKYNRPYCAVCGISSEYDPDAEVQKSPALDKLNDYLERREGYVRRLEDRIAKLNGIVDNLECENQRDSGKPCHELGLEHGARCQACEAQRLAGLDVD